MAESLKQTKSSKTLRIVLLAVLAILGLVAAIIGAGPFIEGFDYGTNRDLNLFAIVPMFIIAALLLSIGISGVVKEIRRWNCYCGGKMVCLCPTNRTQDA